jgi:hypothetical protein
MNASGDARYENIYRDVRDFDEALEPQHEQLG